MGWFSRPKPPVRVKIAGMSALVNAINAQTEAIEYAARTQADAIREAGRAQAEATRYAAKLAAGRVKLKEPPPPPAPPVDPVSLEFARWLETKDWPIEQTRQYQIYHSRYLGRLPATPEQKQIALVALRNSGAPLTV